MTPDFSKGTVALDEETGKPVVAREAAVAPPSGEAGGSIDALAGAMEEISGQPAPEGAARCARGRQGPIRWRWRARRGEIPAQLPIRSRSLKASRKPPAGSAEAAPRAQAACESWLNQDPWSRLNRRVDYADPDTEKTYKFRTLKGQGDLAKRGFMRQADYTRKTMFLADARRDLEPLIADGRLKAIQPLLRRALDDPEFGNFVVDAYNRRLAGQPLTPAPALASCDAVQAAAASARRRRCSAAPRQTEVAHCGPGG